MNDRARPRPRLRSRALEPLRRYVVRHAAAHEHDDAIAGLRARVDRLEQLVTELHGAVAPLRAMTDLPATVQEAVVTLADRIEAVERDLSAARGGEPRVS